MRLSETEDAGRTGQVVGNVINKRKNDPEGLTALKQEAHFLPRGDLQKGPGREFEGRETVSRFEEAQN
jgi:hypothetical protein